MKKLVVCLSIMLAGCGALDGDKVRQELGLAGQAPDEFLVISREPLVIPQNLQLGAPQLEMPQPGAPSRVEISPMQQASSVLLGEQTTQEATFRALSPAESALLQQAGADEEGGDIRQTLAEEGGNSYRDQYLMYRIFPNLRTPGERNDTVNARAEAERLRATGVQNVPEAPPLPEEE